MDVLRLKEDFNSDQEDESYKKQVKKRCYA